MDANRKGFGHQESLDRMALGNGYRQKDPFTPEDIEKIGQHILELSYPDEWRTAILFGLTLGMRIGDTVSRSWEEICLNDPPSITFTPGKTRSRNIVVSAPILDPLLSWIIELAGKSERLGPIIPNLGKKDKSDVSREFSQYIREIGIPMRMEKGVKVWYSKSFHSFRATCASMMAAKGVPSEIRKQIIGHLDDDVHDLYTHYQDSVLREALEKGLEGVRF